MKLGFVFLLVLFTAPASAASPFADCVKAAEQDLKACLDNAISIDDKNTCEEKREEQMKRCAGGECTAERLDRERERKKNVSKEDQ